MIELFCGGDLVKLGIQLIEGLNITAFLDHLDLCETCSEHKEALINELNCLIGGGPWI